MLYTVKSGRYVVMTGERGLAVLERAWHQACIDYITSNGGSIDIPKPEVTVPENAAQNVAKERFHL